MSTCDLCVLEWSPEWTSDFCWKPVVQIAPVFRAPQMLWAQRRSWSSICGCQSLQKIPPAPVIQDFDKYLLCQDLWNSSQNVGKGQAMQPTSLPPGFTWTLWIWLKSSGSSEPCRGCAKTGSDFGQKAMLRPAEAVVVTHGFCGAQKTLWTYKSSI